MEARRSPAARDYRSGAVKFSDAVVELMAYLNKHERDRNG